MFLQPVLLKLIVGSSCYKRADGSRQMTNHLFLITKDEAAFFDNPIPR